MWQVSRETVGQNIRQLRLHLGMTQEMLAIESGVTRNVLVDVESGKRGLLYERIIDIAAALDVAVADLFLGVDSQVRRSPKRKKRK